MKAENIKFKAKRLDGKEWVCGNLRTSKSGNAMIIPIDNSGAYPVEPTTVCQFIGLVDMNGVEVYENDIVKVVDWEETICNVEYKDYGFCLCSKAFRNGKIGYWHSRYDLYCMGFDGCRDHRITKAEKITARYSRKLINCLARLEVKTHFEMGDIISNANKIKSFGV